VKQRRGAGHRLDRIADPSLRNWGKPRGPAAEQMASDAVVDMGWGSLIFAHTFDDKREVVNRLCDEPAGRRNIALYLRDPHVLISLAPHRVFLDPSHTYRLWLHHYQQGGAPPRAFRIRRLETRRDADEINRIYAARKMVTCDADALLHRNATLLHTDLVAESIEDGQIVGVVTGIDHAEAFNDPENGSSLWCLAVDPQCTLPAVGQWLVRHLCEHYHARGRAFVDLSVMHDNEQAIALYEKLGFRRVPVFCVKHKSPMNEPLFIAPQPPTELNPYAELIVTEARRRGIDVELLDAENAYFRLRFGGRSIVCRESLTELTTAIAMSRCDDKRVTRRVLAEAGLNVPAQRVAETAAPADADPGDDDPGGDEAGSLADGDAAFLAEQGRLVVKPLRGEQGAGITVGVKAPAAVRRAIRAARRYCDRVLLEQFVEGEDLRVIVIDYRVVAAAVRRPPIITGTGKDTIARLVERYSRRRAGATGGESEVPLDEQTAQCVADAGYALDDVLPAREQLRVRKTANLHTGGTIHDVTHALHPRLAAASVAAARAINIPVVGLDLLVPDPAQPDADHPEYVIIEANERPGLANHEPQPTAERFIDLLFPHSDDQRA